ncbi:MULTISPECIES: tRNA (adenosine(37)-N6)-dimethylallyltransferase MiaA [unclassified Rothia (in: high G+C Gram-positive bacteria)]|uniref:tRNA (adenosine(37)-N6)-dimethylallyltransferase MiaA n=1 Tax=unclassified Rothia (in: high G+C Gram-positive bacteria) TaxID=2689056 RepID=UPI001959514B|nr:MULTISPECIES: tRNA (adenosine(37)-N6)-dimethylallyltransferase MiaA [unclassified Rothia (in: high G+C Gram-positive bacteria)]MBM7051283.1 tRNA (adenosine(37)-N6)-dimethylallyltransferase MiaA [Rothia sp. ZJ1223]QRZ61078.1 tRNA (adenosine(37)-N6)-dimethylallyltransferase MiaA [Rothia sp. ZJ932]
MNTLPVISVVGPTGSGKSDLAIELALELGGECINADSMQFYRGMDIGTAKVTSKQMKGVPHHLLDIMDVRDEASVATFQAQARALCEEVRARGHYPILVGGSGLYVRAVLDVLEFPETDPAVRVRLEEELATSGRGVLLARLAEVDPESASRVKDDRRLVRALEVYEVTGRTFTSFMPRREYVTETVQIGLNGDRAQLHERLHRRVELMDALGLLDEVSSLEKRGLREGKTASRAIGYREYLRLLDAQRGVPEATGYTREQAIEDTVTATRQFARRQITWFNADDRVNWLDWADADLRAQALARVHKSEQ